MSIILNDVSKAFEQKQVLEHFSFSFPERGVIAVMGKSGSGKSTLINLLLGLVKPDEGEISIPSDTRFSVVFQEDRLMEHLSAYDNLRLTTGCRRAEIFSALEALGLNGADRSPVKTYSGGMKRRVALARGILFRADVLLLDEPFRGLDEETREQAIDYLMRQWSDRLIILVTHDEEEARRMGAAQTVLIESHE